MFKVGDIVFHEFGGSSTFRLTRHCVEYHKTWEAEGVSGAHIQFKGLLSQDCLTLATKLHRILS